MNSRRMFARIWRINAVLILVTGVLACCVLAYAAIEILRDATRPREAIDIVNVAPNVGKETSRLGTFAPIGGTTVLRAPLYRDQEYELAVSSKETTSIQNYLFFDPATGASYWLLPGNAGLVTSTHHLPQTRYAEVDRPTKIVFYEISEVDSDKDQRLTSKDLKTIYSSDPTGRRLVPVARSVSEVHGVELSDETAVVLYTSSRVLRAAIVDVATMRVRRDSPVTPQATQ